MITPLGLRASLGRCKVVEPLSEVAGDLAATVVEVFEPLDRYAVPSG